MARVQSKTEALRAYRDAFEEFSLRAKRAQDLIEHANPDRAILDRALLDLERARVAYSRSRDVVFQQMLPGVFARRSRNERADDTVPCARS